MSESTALAETPVTPSPSDPAPQATPAEGQDAQNQIEATPPSDSEPGAPQAANPDPGQQGDEAEKARKKQSAQDRFDQLTALRRAAERRAVVAEARAKQLEDKAAQPRQATTLEEQERFNVQQAVREERIDDLRGEANNAREEAWGSIVSAARAKAEAVADRMPDLISKLQALPKLSAETVHFIAESDKGAEVAFHLANNPAEATRIAELHPLHQGIELARLEGKFANTPQPRKVSTAPQPVPTVAGNPSTATRDPFDMNEAEYVAHYAKREAAKRKGKG